MEVFNGDTKDIKKRVAKLCGSDLPDPIESSGNTLILKFSSDYAIGYKGFKLQLTKTGVALVLLVLISIVMRIILSVLDYKLRTLPEFKTGNFFSSRG